MPLLPANYLKSLLPKDIELALQTALNTKATFGDDWRIEPHPGGYSLCSLGVLYPDWKGISEEEKLDDNFIVKITRRNKRLLEDGHGGQVLMEQKQYERRNRRKLHQHNTETFGLRLLNQRNCFITPKMYVYNELTEESDVGYIVLQTIPHIRSMDIYDLAPERTIIQALEWLVDLQIFGASDAVSQNKKLTMVREKADWLELISIKRLQDTIERVFAGQWEVGREELVNRAREALLDLKEEDECLVHNVDKDLGIEPVLCHGDMYSRNLMVDENYTLKAVIDFQQLHYGNIAQDVTFLLFDLLRGKNRIEQVQRYIGIFYQIMCDKTSGNPLYSLENLMESHSRLVAIAALFDAKCWWMQSEEVIAKLEPEKQLEARQIIAEKYEALLETFIYYHNENRKRFSKCASTLENYRHENDTKCD